MITIHQNFDPSEALVSKQYDQGEYSYFDVFGEEVLPLASFAVGVRGEQALFLWTIHAPSATFFRNCKKIVLPFVRDWCQKSGCTMLVSATGAPERDPDFDRVSSFFGFKPTLRTAAMEI